MRGAAEWAVVRIGDGQEHYVSHRRALMLAHLKANPGSTLIEITRAVYGSALRHYQSCRAVFSLLRRQLPGLIEARAMVSSRQWGSSRTRYWLTAHVRFVRVVSRGEAG